MKNLPGAYYWIVGALLANLTGLALALALILPLQGRGLSDLGVPLVEKPQLPVLFGLLVYLSVVIAGYFALRKFHPQAIRKRAYPVACLLFFIPAMGIIQL